MRKSANTGREYYFKHIHEPQMKKLKLEKNPLKKGYVSYETMAKPTVDQRIQQYLLKLESEDDKD